MRFGGGLITGKALLTDGDTFVISLQELCGDPIDLVATCD